MQYAIIISSGRLVRVERCGKLLFILHPQTQRDRISGYQSVSTPRYDKNKFWLLPKTFKRK